MKRLTLLFGAAVFSLTLATGAAHAQNQIQDQASKQCWTAGGNYAGTTVSLAPCTGSMLQNFNFVPMSSQQGNSLIWLNNGSWQFCLKAGAPITLDGCWDNASWPVGFTLNSDGTITSWWMGNAHVIFQNGVATFGSGQKVIYGPLAATPPPANQAPILANVATAATYVPGGSDGGHAVVLSPSATVSDDSGNLASATVAITRGFTNGDVLGLVTTVSGITASYNLQNGALTLTGGASASSYQAALDHVAFLFNGAPAQSSTRTISWMANDGSLNSNVATTALSVEVATPPPTQMGALSIGFEGPLDPSLPHYAPYWNTAADYNYWGNLLGISGAAISQTGGGIAYDTWDDYDSSAHWFATIAQYEGRAHDKVWVNLPPIINGTSLATAATGAYNSHYTNAAQQMVKAGYDAVVWRLIWEWEGSWYPWGWQANGGYPGYCTDFKAAFHQMVVSIRSVMPNAKFAWNMADATIMPTWQDCEPDPNDYDWVAMDTYDGLRSETQPASARWNQDQAPGIAATQALALARRKGWAVAEWSVGAMGDNPLYVNNMRAAMAAYQARGLPVFSGYWNNPDPKSNYVGYLNDQPLTFAEFTKPSPAGFHQ